MRTEKALKSGCLDAGYPLPGKWAGAVCVASRDQVARAKAAGRARGKRNALSRAVGLSSEDRAGWIADPAHKRTSQIVATAPSLWGGPSVQLLPVCGLLSHIAGGGRRGAREIAWSEALPGFPCPEEAELAPFLGYRSRSGWKKWRRTAQLRSLDVQSMLARNPKRKSWPTPCRPPEDER